MVYVNGDSTINGKDGSTKVSKLYKKKEIVTLKIVKK
jgi:hypothetical protein